MERVKCNLCGSSESTPWQRVEGWQIVRCANCGLGYLNPRPTEDELSKLYDEIYFKKHSIEAGEEEEEIEHGLRLNEERIALVEMFRKPGRILDIGCASGFFLAAAKRRGWDVTGVEVSEWSARRAARLIGDSVVVGQFMDVELPEASFDAVTMWDVLEHTNDPKAVLRRIRSILEPDGIVVVRVPNCASFDAYLFGRKWNGWSVPFHPHHFTPKTLDKMLQAAGLTTVYTEKKISSTAWNFLKGVKSGILGLLPRRDRAQTGDAASRAGPARRRETGPRALFVRLFNMIFTGRSVTAVARKTGR